MAIGLDTAVNVPSAPAVMVTPVTATAEVLPQDAPPQAVVPPAERRLDLPEAVQPVRIYWEYAIPLTLVHILSLLAFVPWLFSWAGLVAAIVTHFVFGVLGITVGYHRLLTHQGFTCPKWLEHTLAIFGIFTLQDSPARWVAIHRMHHKESDHQPDPHSPLAGFFWGHMGWL
jgi:stearoyl-CoA desaturase (delta-9 desaturase)